MFVISRERRDKRIWIFAALRWQIWQEPQNYYRLIFFLWDIKALQMLSRRQIIRPTRAPDPGLVLFRPEAFDNLARVARKTDKISLNGSDGLYGRVHG